MIVVPDASVIISLKYLFNAIISNKMKVIDQFICFLLSYMTMAQQPQTVLGIISASSEKLCAKFHIQVNTVTNSVCRILLRAERTSTLTPL